MKIEDYRKKKKYDEGAMKRKLKISAGKKVEPGDMITKMNEMKGKKKVAFLGMI